ncbi:hypothetical protein [Siphonobacter sp.]|uniref:hypothetical protein n=1 Tax=Siphonobacter sp. TaxID=1869184 RepID=UPI003B3A0478
MHEISRWLQDPDYEKGVALYDRFGNSSSLKVLFHSGESSLSRPKLKQALTELASQLPAAKPSVATVAKPIEHLKSVRPSQLPDAPAEVKALVQKRREHYDEMRVQHSRLKHLSTDIERFEAAKQIISQEGPIWELWEQTNYYDEHLKLLPPAPTVQVENPDRATLRQKLTNLRTYVSKHKKNPAREADVLAWQAQIRQLEDQIAHL